MLIKTVFAGFGGQGVLSMGLNLAQAALLEGKNVTYLPSYGAVAMNQPSMVRFQNQIQSGGVLFINSSLIETEISRGDVDIIKVPANSIAEQLGSLRSANMVMLGAFTKNSNIVSISSVIEGLKSALKKKQKLIAVNTKALMAGYDLF
jgi:2-oxoglutarate ferredoxin oxidoreductase subunit gamma